MRVAHLQVHSHYSLLEATPSLEMLVGRAGDEGMTHLALTDSFALYGAVRFQRLCRKAGIQPLIGMTIKLRDPLVPRLGELVLLATGPEGYRSLCRLSSSVQGHPQREQRRRSGIDWDVLQEHGAGLLCIAGGQQGRLSHHIRQGDRTEARCHLDRLRAAFPSCYLALEVHRPADEALAQEIVAFGRQAGLPAVAVQPVYCLAPEEASTLQLLQAIDRNCPLEEAVRPNPVRHWLSPTEMAARFARFPAALERIDEVVARCGPALPSGEPIWPALSFARPVTEELVFQAEAGFERHYQTEGSNLFDGANRLRHELDSIIEHGFAPLFLIVADIVGYARRTHVPVSTRGSVANSLVAYCLGITTVDPLAHDLLFERFLNPARSSPPDIDLDFCSRRRDEVLAYVRRTYGEEQVALVATISTMRPKSAVRETAKAHGYDGAGIKRLTRLLPRGWHPDPRRRSRRSLEDVLGELDAGGDRLVMGAALRIVGQPHHLSVHPGGLVITPGPLTDVVPVQWAPKGFLITQYDHVDVEAIGLPKLDLLGIRALTVLADAIDLVRRSHLSDLSLDTIPTADEMTAEMLAQGDTIGVFQCESQGAQRTLRQLKAQTVSDLAVANAFFKPGPATGGMARAFIRRYRGQEKVSYLHPSLEPILGPTKGVLLFQEQILRLAREIAGLSWEQADHLRRGMSKFQPDEMALIEEQFQAGCHESGLNVRQAATLWQQVLAFAGYGFNQGHATAYAAVSYQSAYLKAHWPAAFLWARLVNAGGFHHPAIYMAEAVRLGCRVRSPHVNVSERRFTLTQHDGVSTLWMGLAHVRDLRRASVRSIIASRPFVDLRDLLARVSLQDKEVKHLIQCGALDGLGKSRAALLDEAEEVDRAGSPGQMSLAFISRQQVAPEGPAERIAWERRVLGQPVSTHPLTLVPEADKYVPLSVLRQARSQPVEVRGVRLPGWTGGPGFFLGDEEAFVVARMDGDAPAVWEPVRLQGQWRTDEWGSGWFQVQQMQML